MPLNTEIERNGEALKLCWGDFHLNAMYTAAIKESAPDTPLEGGGKVGDESCKILNFIMGVYYLHIPGCPLVERGEQTLLYQHEFVDPYDGEVFELLPGDVLRAWRSYK